MLAFHARRAVVAVATATVVLALPAGATAKTHGHGHKHAHHKAPTPSQSATKLVAAVRRAQSPKAQRSAMLALLRKLHVAVYTGDGRALVPHASAARHAFFYDLELAPLAAMLKRGDRISVTDLAARLDKAGLHPTGGSLDPAALAAALAAGVRSDLQHARSANAMPALVLQALGRGDAPRVDLRRLHATDTLDAVQAQLIFMAFAQLAYDTPAGKKPAARRRPAHHARAASGTAVCEGLKDAQDAFLSGGMDGLSGKMMKAVLKKILKQELLTKAERAALKLEQEIVDGLHGSMLAFSVAVHGDPETAGPVHYNHSAAEHNVLAMRIKVEMLDDYGNVAIKCGPLAGLKFPRKGGIPDVPMHWDYPNLAQHGQVICGDGCTKTASDGVATLQLAVNTERIPGYGLEQEATDNADAVASYQSAFGAGLTNPSFFAQYLTPKIGGVRWVVHYHKEPTLRMRFLAQHDETYTDQPKSQFESTGTGAMHVAVSSDSQLSEVATSDGSRLWTGDAPLNWDRFEYHDDGGKALCQDGKSGTIDFDGQSPSPGELIVDSVQQQDPNAGPAGLAVTLHASREPSFTVLTAFHHGASTCGDFSNTSSRDWWTEAFTYARIPPVAGNVPQHASPTYKVTGFQPGPGSGGGEGVYAYRDLPYSDTDAYGQPISGTLRLEIVAVPSP